MKTIIKYLAALALLFATAPLANAQWRFVADKLTADSTRVFNRALNPDKREGANKYIINGTAFYVPNGDTLFVAKGDGELFSASYKVHDEPGFQEKWYSNNNERGRFLTVTIKGKKYFVDVKDLVLVEGTEEEWWTKAANKHHTPMGHWYSTPTPHWLVVCLVFAALACAIIGGKAESPAISWLTIPFLAAAVALEFLGIYYTGTDLLWWMNQKVYGFWPAAGGACLLGITALVQFFSMMIMVGPDNEEMSYLWPLLTIIGGLIIAIVLIVIEGLNDGDHGLVQIGIIIWAASILLGLIVTFVKNMRTLTLIGGFFFSLFVIIWTLGVLAMVGLVFIGIITYFADTIIMIVGFALAFGLSKMFPDFVYTLADGTVVKVFYK
ncbi:MAG: hypothetical protein J5771_07160 [Bacteroidales bacterium]|nr:hypothetical protein [Bacteroidales bacterium]